MSQHFSACAAAVSLQQVQLRLVSSAWRVSCACCVLMVLSAAAGLVYAQEGSLQNSFAGPRITTSSAQLDERRQDSLRRSLGDTRLQNSAQYERRRLTVDERSTLRRELRESLKDAYPTPPR